MAEIEAKPKSDQGTCAHEDNSATETSPLPAQHIARSAPLEVSVSSLTLTAHQLPRHWSQTKLNQPSWQMSLCHF